MHFNLPEQLALEVVVIGVLEELPVFKNAH